ncbi:FCD domain-containing protein [Nocardia vinacea]|uniref:FCD domain-containing protein n=1 Tax=Nocardia vinacea TaxID=96468 RepID=UPI0034038BE1
MAATDDGGRRIRAGEPAAFPRRNAAWCAIDPIRANTKATATARLLAQADRDAVIQGQRRTYPPVTAADTARDTELDLEFHTFFRDRAGNRPLADELARLEAQAHLYRGDLWRSELNRRVALREHRRIVEALESGHAQDARGGRGARLWTCHSPRPTLTGIGFACGGGGFVSRGRHPCATSNVVDVRPVPQATADRARPPTARRYRSRSAHLR